MNEKYVVANGIELAYEAFGNPSHPAIILITGMSAQLTTWPIELCQQVAAMGYWVLRYDHRDIGLSEKMSSAKSPKMLSVMTRLHFNLPIKVPYTLEDMSDDVIGLMQELNIDKAHFVGVSMGGMIAQLCAIRHPNKALSLTSMMSTSGSPWLPGPKPAISLHMMKPRPTTEEAIIQRGVKTLRLAAGSKYRQSYDEMYSRMRDSFHRSHYPEGAVRHMLAIAGSGNRVRALRKVRTPTLVVHGRDDPLVRLAAGRSTARLIPGAKLEVIDGLGHDLPACAVPRLMQALAPHLQNSSQRNHTLE